MPISKLPGTEAGSLMQELRAVNRERYDYSEFLKSLQFSAKKCK